MGTVAAKLQVRSPGRDVQEVQEVAEVQVFKHSGTQFLRVFRKSGATKQIGMASDCPKCGGDSGFPSRERLGNCYHYEPGTGNYQFQNSENRLNFDNYVRKTNRMDIECSFESGKVALIDTFG